MWLGEKVKSVLQGLLVIQTACMGNTAGQRAWRHWQHGSKLGHHSSRAASRHRIELLGNWGAMRKAQKAQEAQQSDQLSELSGRKHERPVLPVASTLARPPWLRPGLRRRGVRFPVASVVASVEWHRWHQRHRGWASGWLGVPLL